MTMGQTWISSFLSIMVLWASLPAQAQVVNFSPEVMTIEGTRDHVYLPPQIQDLPLMGLKGRSVTRSILLDADTTLENLRFLTLDLSSPDGLEVLPADRIHLTLQPISEVDPDLVRVTITLDLRESPQSGEFSGKILFRYSGGEESLPLTVRVRDPWLVPLSVLLLGIILGTSLAWYQTQGRLRDELSVRENRLRRQLLSDDQLKETFSPFYDEINRKLLRLTQALQTENQEMAKQALVEGEQLWLHWQAYESDWLEQAKYYQELKNLITTEEREHQSCFFLTEVKQQLDRVFESAPLQSAEESWVALQQCGEALRRYKTIDVTLNEMQTTLSALENNPQYPQWAQTLKDVRQQLSNTDPFPAEDTLEAGMKALHDRIEALSQAFNYQSQTKTVVHPQVSVQVPQVPKMRMTKQPITLFPQGKFLGRTRARWKAFANGVEEAIAWLRLKVIFPYATSAVFIAFLASSGFQELYLQNPTFGSRPFADYFGLLAWGFGAEASRESVGRVLGAKKEDPEPQAEE